MAKRKKYSNKLTKLAKENMKLGVVSMTGQYAVGSISSLVPGSAGTANIINTGLRLTNIGQLAKTAKKII